MLRASFRVPNAMEFLGGWVIPVTGIESSTGDGGC